jgi:hypothetical protein
MVLVAPTHPNNHPRFANSCFFQYEKPEPVLAEEARARQERMRSLQKQMSGGAGGEGDVDCKQQ